MRRGFDSTAAWLFVFVVLSSSWVLAWRLSPRPSKFRANVYTPHQPTTYTGLRSVSGDRPEFECFDEAVIFVRGGSGGSGSHTFKFGKARQHKRPMGGSGGDGGSVYLTGDNNVNTLRAFRHSRSFRAANGMDGDVDFANGAKGADLFVQVPVGTLVFDNATAVCLGEIKQSTGRNERVLVAKGGKGGVGNAGVAVVRGEKNVAAPPEGGERRCLRLELKLIADVGLVGLPNAGKSTLLDALTNAKPKIADYAFTTLVPNLGVCYYPSSEKNSDANDDSFLYNAGLVLADIPGLIEDAHKGKGLGKGFLRHVERCQVLLHVISAQSPDPVRDYLVVNQELISHSPLLAEKPQIVVINKIDTLMSSPENSATFSSTTSLEGDQESRLNSIQTALLHVMPHSRILRISAKEGLGLSELVPRLWKFVQKVKTVEEEF